MEQTLIIIKPDAVQRGIVGEILTRFEKKGFKIIGLKMIRLREAILREHYAHVADEPFFEELSKFMGSSPVLVICLEGLNAINVVRMVAGTKSDQLGTIRGDFAASSQRNLIHSSDSTDTAKREIKRFFTKEELFDYDKDEWKHIYAQSDGIND